MKHVGSGGLRAAWRAAGWALGGGLCAAALVSCGGDGASGSSTSESRVAVDAATAPAVSAQALDAGGAGSLDAFGAVGSGSSASAASGATPGTARLLTSLGRWTREAALGHNRATAQAAAQGVSIGPRTLACRDGGTVTVEGSAATAGRLSAGDHLGFRFDGCIERFATLDGTLDLTVVSANVALTLLVADVTADTLTARVGRSDEQLDGDLRVTVDERDSRESVVAVAGDSFRYARSVDGQLRASRTLLDYQARSVTDSGTGDTSTTFSYTVGGSFPRLGEVSWQASTLEPLVTPAGAALPVSGQIEANGAEGSSVAITVTATGLHLEIDSSGDGRVDDTRDLSWDEVDALR